MSEEMGDEDSGDFWLRNWEQQCIGELENDGEEPGVQVQRELEALNHALYHKFQAAATSVAQLYKDRIQGSSMWTPFQNAAGSLTALYKDGNEALRRSSELGFAMGSQKRTKEILAWAKRKRRHIHREDLISFLCGKPTPDLPSGPTVSAGTPGHRHQRSSPRPRFSGERRLTQSESVGNSAVTEELLHTFQEAVAVATLNAAVGSVRPQNQAGGGGGAASGASVPANQSVAARRGAVALGAVGGGGRPSPQHYVELNNFVVEEFARHGLKRPAPPSPPHQDEIMDSPTHKKPRFN